MYHRGSKLDSLSSQGFIEGAGQGESQISHLKQKMFPQTIANYLIQVQYCNDKKVTIVVTLKHDNVITLLEFVL